MYAVVRRYTGASELADVLVQHLEEVKGLLTEVPGFKAYHALRTANGSVVTMTVCEDQAGTQESSRPANACCDAAIAGMPSTTPSSAAATVPE